jgi:MPBQ/MSBQ methyltransferase
VPAAHWLAGHYAAASTPAQPLLDGLLAALRAAGLDPNSLQLADLAPLDQFHSRGRTATRELASRAALQPADRVLDLGGGLGGAARTLAAEFGCTVLVHDLTLPYVQAGAALTHLTGLSERVSFRHGDALALPDPDGAFDVVWSQHSTMNIADKARLCAEARRVLRPGGRLALHEVAAGPGGPPHFPLPWAAGPAGSHLLPAGDMRAFIARAGFVETAWVDESSLVLAAFQAQLDRLRANGVPPALGLHLLLGDAFHPMFANLTRSLKERRLAVIQAVFTR